MKLSVKDEAMDPVISIIAFGALIGAPIAIWGQSPELDPMWVTVCAMLLASWLGSRNSKKRVPKYARGEMGPEVFFMGILYALILPSHYFEIRSEIVNYGIWHGVMTTLAYCAGLWLGKTITDEEAAQIRGSSS